MARGTSSTGWIIGAVCSTSGNIMNFYGSNFNMPVPNLFNGSSNCSSGFMAARCNNIGSTSHALTGIWYPGYEFALADYLPVWWADEGTCTCGVGCFQMQWYRPSGAINYNKFQVAVSVTSCPGWCSWSWYEGMVNTGIAGWEICDTTTSTHCNVMQVTQVSGDPVAIGACTISFDLGGVPSTSQCSSSLRGSIWVEGNDLHYINANQWEHAIVGTCIATGFGNCGSIWIDNSHYLHWVGADGNDYRAPWRICQFCSSFSNGAGPNPSPGAGYAGSLWVDQEFGYTHLAYIGCDGNKYLAGAGHYPYSF
jgi:hypothetical protein